MSAVATRLPGHKRLVRRHRKPVTCQRCGWTWVPYGRKMPERCARRNCRSPYWNRPRKTADAKAAS